MTVKLAVALLSHEYIHGILDDMLGFQYLIKFVTVGSGNFGGPTGRDLL